MIDIPVLMEELRTLSDVVPLLTKHVADAQHEAETLEAAAEQLQREVDEAKEEAATRLAALQMALPVLVTRVEAEEKLMKDADTAMVDAWHETEPVLARSGDATMKLLDELLSHEHDLREALAEAGTKIDQSQAVGEAALARLEHDTHDAEQRLQVALKALQAEVEVFKQLTQAANDAVTDAARELIGGLAATCGQATHATEVALEAMTAKTTAHKDTAHDLFETLSGHVMEKVDEADGQVEHAITAPVAEAEEHVRVDVERLGSGAGTHEEDLAHHGEALDAAMGAVKKDAEALPSGLAQIQQAAQQLGI